MKRFFKTKNLLALLICMLFLTACGVATDNIQESSVSSVSETESSSQTTANDSQSKSDDSTSNSSVNKETGAATSINASSTSTSFAASTKAGTVTGSKSSTTSKTSNNSTSKYSTSSKTSSSSSSKYSTSSKTSKPTTSNSTTTQTNSKPSTTTSTTSGTNQLTYSRQVITLVNQERAKQGLSALKENTSLMDSSLTRSKELVTKFAHERPNGQQGYQLAINAGFRTAGENIAYGYASPSSVMEGWMNSAGHRANILNANYTQIGVGCYKGSNGQLYWTQLFGG